MKFITFLILTIGFNALCFSQNPNKHKMTPKMTEIWEPEIEKITPGDKPGKAPSDAIILFDGTNMNEEWVNAKNDSLPGWKVENGTMTVVPYAGHIKTKRKFSSVQLHIEWKTPVSSTRKGQRRGNSGVIFHGGYEVQILDNYNNQTYKNGQAASIYKQYAPRVNACKKPGQWQSYDIVFNAPHFKEDGSYLVPPRITLFHNGVLVQNAVELRGPTVYIGIPEYKIKKHGPGPITLQDHKSPVSFRNIWIRKIE